MSLEFNSQLRKNKSIGFDQLQDADSSFHKSYYTIIGVLQLSSIPLLSILSAIVSI